MTYEIKKYGQITKFEAGAIYRAMKEGKVTVLPETTKSLYNQVNDDYRAASQRYSQNNRSYDFIYDATAAIIDGDFETAQEKLNAWEHMSVRLATKRNPFYKYRDQFGITEADDLALAGITEEY